MFQTANSTQKNPENREPRKQQAETGRPKHSNTRWWVVETQQHPRAEETAETSNTLTKIPRKKTGEISEEGTKKPTQKAGWTGRPKLKEENGRKLPHKRLCAGA
jgi:hypothetical protein